MVSHVRVRLSADRSAKRMSGCQRIVSREGPIDGKSCPREVVNGLLRITDERMFCGLIGLSRFCRNSPDVHVGAGIGRG